MADNKKIFELYNLMEEKLQELDITFDEFTILYKSFRDPSVKEETEAPRVKATPPNPFPWAQAAGAGWSPK